MYQVFKTFEEMMDMEYHGERLIDIVSKTKMGDIDFLSSEFEIGPVNYYQNKKS